MCWRPASTECRTSDSEEVGATLYAGAGLTEDQVRAFLEPRLARFEIPRYLRFANAPLPRTASGKILKRQLREDAARELGKS